MNAQPTIARGPLVEAPLRFQLRSGGAPAKDSAFITCPKCEAPAFIRKSDRMSATVKHLVCHCTNSGCGHVFRSQVSFRDTLVVGNCFLVKERQNTTLATRYEEAFELD